MAVGQDGAAVSVRDGAAGSVRAGLWWNIALLLAALRLATLLQMLPSLPTAVRVSERPGLTVVSWGLAALLTAVLCIGVARNRRPPGNRLACLDVAGTLALFWLGSLTVPTDERIGNWIGFQPAYALSMLIAVSMLSSRIVWYPALVLISVADVLFCSPDAGAEGVPTVIGNLLTLIVLPQITRVAFAYCTRIADLADHSTARVAEFARRDEERRAQAAMHNGAAVMAMLARDDLAEPVREALREQAREETERMRRYLSGRSVGAATRATLAGAITDVTAGFSDLRIDLNLDLGRHVVVSGDEVDAISAALGSLLLNVRLHAGADRVVVHLDEEDGRWTLTVHDNGVGFDTSLVDEGVGLREVVRAALARRGVTVSIDSMLGVGTTVVLTGEWQEVDDESSAG